jgi:hypothetical protein
MVHCAPKPGEAASRSASCRTTAMHFCIFEARRGYNSISLLSACVMIELPNGYPTLEWSAKQLVMDNPALYYTRNTRFAGS